MAPVLDALGDDLDELVELLIPWGRAIRAAKGYLASGPHDLAAKTRPGEPSAGIRSSIDLVLSF